MQDYFFCNGLIRLFMEIAFELSLVTVLNMRTVDWETQFRAVKYSTAFSIISLIHLVVLPILLTLFYYKNFSKLRQKNFRDKCGSALLGTKVDVSTPKKSILAYPAIFFARRILFAVSAVYLGQFLWA